MDKITEHHIERISGASYELGKISGRDDVIHFLLEQSSRLFANEKDDAAKLVRSLAQELKRKNEEYRKEYDSTNRKYSDESWSILDEAIKEVGYS